MATRTSEDHSAKNSLFTRGSVFGLFGGLVIVGFFIWHYLLGSSLPYMPHGHCYLWNPALLWLHVGSDGIIAASYIAISATLAYLVLRGQRDLPFHWVMLSFATFIIACAGTHVMEVVTVWSPQYWFSGLVKLLTAVASLSTAIILPPLIPKILGLLQAARLSNERKVDLEAAHAELAIAYDKIKQLDSVRTAFFANVSHELRTPLALIFGPVDKLLTQRDLTEAQRYNLDVIRRNAVLLHKHVNDLLDISKLEAGKLRMDYCEEDLARLVKLVGSYFESISEERFINFSIDCPATAPSQIDSEKIQRVLLNLLSNAFKFTPEGGTVKFSLSIQDNVARFVVDDSGPGIPAAIRDVIFERFVQGEELTGPSLDRKFGGTGLGLSIVKEFVGMHHGKVIVTDSSLGGARFEIHLPLKAPADTAVRGLVPVGGLPEPSVKTLQSSAEEIFAAITPPVASPQVAPPDQTPPPHISSSENVSQLPQSVVLVVEDNPEMNEFITEILSPEFHTLSANNGAKALEIALETKPDLIISDLMMPGMSGVELLRRLRAKAELATIPVILLTARVDEETRSTLLREGAQDYITKPFAVEELIARARNQVAAKKVRDALQSILESQDEDISRLALEITRRTHDLQAAKDAAEEANNSKDRFLAILSHELRTPLMPVLTGVLELEADPHLRQEMRSILRVIRLNVELEARLIDDLLDLTCAAKGTLKIHRENVDAHELLQTAIHQFDSQVRNKSHHLTLQLQADRHWVSADGPRLLQVFTNLIGNANKFTPLEGAISIRTWNNEANALMVEVRDNGIGISPEILPRLFKPFEHGNDSIARRYGGLGLGLALSKALMDAHCGTIEAISSGENQGAVFTIALSSLAISPTLLIEPTPAIQSEIPHKPRILLVEDHEDTRLALSRLIGRWGYEVTAAMAVSKALEVARQESFDLLISDLGLPDGSGMDLIKALHAQPATQTLKGVAISGFGMEEDIRRSREAGFEEHLTKPVAAAQLKATIERLLAND